MIVHTRWTHATVAGVNPYVPSVVALGGLVGIVAGFHTIGTGVAIGAGLAFLNALMLARRVDVAAEVGNMAVALLVMQLGLLLACTLIGVVTIVMIRFSLSLALANVVGFIVTHLGILIAYYWGHARQEPALEGERS